MSAGSCSSFHDVCGSRPDIDMELDSIRQALESDRRSLHDSSSDNDQDSTPEAVYKESDIDQNRQPGPVSIFGHHRPIQKGQASL